MSIFSYSLLLKILKFRRWSLRLVFLIKIVHNQFLLLKNYRIWYWIRSFVFPLIWNLLYLISPQATKSQLQWSQLKFVKCEIKGVRKRGKQARIEAEFSNSIGGREWKFCLSELQLFNAFLMLSMTCVYIHKAWNLKYDITEMTAATNEDCTGWLLENCCLIGKKWNFWLQKI